MRKARKSTREKVDAINRVLELRGANYRVSLDENKRIVRVPVIAYDDLWSGPLTSR